MSEVVCVCGKAFAAKSNRARYCSDRCRKRAQRGGGEVVELPAKVGQVEVSPSPRLARWRLRRLMP